MIDVMYPLGKGTVWEDNELKYSLRSIEKHLSNFRDIYIVGEKPNFLNDKVIHIPYEDTNRCKETNIYSKILHVCSTNISDQFLFFNDDHFLAHNYDAAAFPFYYKGDLVSVIQRIPQNLYTRSVILTAQLLQGLGLTTLNFDTHTPIIYDKYKFPEVMGRYDWTNRFGFVVKSLYGNSLGIEGVREPDCKINYPIDTKEQLFNAIKDRKVWSIGNKGISEGLKQGLEELYPTPSRWEKEHS
jgi:hypothetical protein